MRTSLLLLFFMALPLTVNAQSEFNSTARSAASAAGGSVSGLNAEESLGVTASGSMNSGRRDVSVNYAQVLESDFRCPVDGSAGHRSGIGQFVVQCESQSGNSRKVWVCVPDDPNDIMGRDCENGKWFNSSLAVGNSSWTGITAGVGVRVPSCDGDDCEVQLRRSGEFDGGQGAAEAQGESIIANSNGAHQTINNQGAYLPDGTALRPGSNPNSGQLAGEMVAANSTASCADDIKTSLNEGTPVFTCDGQKEVGVLTTNQGECEDVEACLETETETLTSTQRCTVSVLYEGAECNVQTPTKSCTVMNIYNTYTCNKSVNSDVRVRLRYDTPSACTSVNGSTFRSSSKNISPAQIKQNFQDWANRINFVAVANGHWPVSIVFYGDVVMTVPQQSTNIGVATYIYNNQPSGGWVRTSPCLGRDCMTQKPAHIINPAQLCGAGGGSCGSGFSKSNGYCYENTSLSGYGYIGSKVAAIGGYNNPIWQYYEKQNINNGCSLYESNR